MSTATLAGLRDYLYDTLSPDNMIWLGTQLTEYGHKQEEHSPKPYTIEEINARLDLAEADFAAGKGIPDEEAWSELDDAITRDNREPEMAEAV